MNPLEIDGEFESASLTGYRLVLRGLARDVQPRVLLPMLKRELGLDLPAIKRLLSRPPQPLWALPDRERARQAQASLAQYGCATSLEDVVRFRDLPFVVATATVDAIDRSLRARATEQRALVLLRALESEAAAAMIDLDLATLQARLGDDCRLEILDCQHRLLSAPVNPREGVMALRFRLQRALSRHLGREPGWSLGIALFPADGEEVEALLLAALRRSGTAPERGAATDYPDTGPVERIDPVRQALTQARGVAFARLQAAPPDALAASLSSLPAEESAAFVARLWLHDDAGLALQSALSATGGQAPADGHADWLSACIAIPDFNAALARRHAQRHRLGALLQDVEQLPALPQVVTQLLQMSLGDAAGADELAALIEQDPGLTARLLAMVNSAFFGFHREITSVRHAVVILGADEISQLATSLASVRLFRIQDRGSGFTTARLWQHANAVAGIARDLAPADLEIAPTTAYTAGLLHDIGRSFLLQHCAELYAEICLEARASSLPLYAVEEDRLGLDHAQIGERLAQRWNLPLPLTAAVGCHHEPARAGEHRALAALVGLADRLHHQAMDGHAVDGMLTIGHRQALEQRFGDLLPESLAMLTEDVAASIARAEALGTG